MSKTAARFTLADIRRATRAAKEQGAEAVEILTDGTIRVVVKGEVRGEVKPEKTKPDPPKYRNFKL